MPKLRSLEDLFFHELKDIYSAEKQLLKALPKMVQAARTPSLRQAFSAHLDQTQSQFDRVHKLLEEFDVNPGSTVCDAMRGLIEEGEGTIDEKASPAVKDAALIAAAQRVEHYEISAYGTARAYAEALGHKSAEKVLRKIRDEESDADEKLNKLALKEVNPAAMKG